MTEILKAQKRLMRAISKSIKRPWESVHNLMTESTHATNCISVNCFKEVYNQLRNASPVKLLNLSELTSQRNTRSAQKSLLHSQKRNSNAGNNSLRVRLVVAYNVLQENCVVR